MKKPLRFFKNFWRRKSKCSAGRRLFLTFCVLFLIAKVSTKLSSHKHQKTPSALEPFAAANISGSSAGAPGPDKFACDPCAHPTADLRLLLPPSTPNCLHAGHPLFRWPSSTRSLSLHHNPNHATKEVQQGNHQHRPKEVPSVRGPCALPAEFRSKQISLDFDSGTIFVRERHCFALLDHHPEEGLDAEEEEWTIEYEFRCLATAERWSNGRLTVTQKQMSRRTVAKRWLNSGGKRHSRRTPSIRFSEEQYSVQVPEDVPVRTEIVQVKAHHARDQPIFYSLGVPDDTRSLNVFSLDTVTGQVRLAKALDRESLSKHALRVIAYERMNPSLSTSVTVFVDVLDVQDNGPVFDRSVYYAEISENAPIGTSVIGVFARDLDNGLNGQVSYSLAPMESKVQEATLNDDQSEQGTKDENGDFLSVFRIDAKTGQVQTIAALDHELHAEYRFRAMAKDGGHPQRTAWAQIEVNIFDVNDNAPAFVDKKCEAEVAEDVDVPALVLNAVAHDADSDVNGRVHYSLVTASVPGLFAVDYTTGAVHLLERPLPRQSPVLLLIRAKDLGQPPLSSTQHCTIHVRDVNDHAPVFVLGADLKQGEALELHVIENALVGHEIGRLLAVDEDTGPNGSVRYLLTSTAAFKRKEKSDEEVFQEIDFLKSLPFEIDEFGGELKVISKLDREKQDEYRFQVMAEDDGAPSRNVSLAVRVLVKDVNDNAPKFVECPGSKTDDEAGEEGLVLDEDTPLGHRLFRVRAEDADAEPPDRIAYRIEKPTGDENPFALTQLGGDQGALITLLRGFSANEERVNVVVSATDSGGLRGFCEFTVRIRDVNRPPTILAQPFTVHVSERATIGSSVLKVLAKDEDRGPNASLRFSFGQNQSAHEFRIDEKSGSVTVQHSLDRENKSHYLLEVLVNDRGEPPLSAGTIFEIIVDDINDNAPRFSKTVYVFEVAEDVPVGTVIGVVHADDPDTGVNGQIVYLLLLVSDEEEDVEADGEIEEQFFRLDLTSGTLRTNRALDRETHREFAFEIVARDRGDPESLSGRAKLQILVTDVNDNPPRFQQQTYEFWINENELPGTLVGTVLASDADEGGNANITFRIIQGSDAALFELDSSVTQGEARILAREPFDHESSAGNRFHIELQASSGQLSSTTSVIVHVLDVNDHSPEIRDFTILIASHVEEAARSNSFASSSSIVSLNRDDFLRKNENDENNFEIGKMPALDSDSNATLEYYLAPNELLTVDASTGALRLHSLDWLQQIDLRIKACVSDGSNTMCAECTLIYTPVSAEALESSIGLSIGGIRRREELLVPERVQRLRAVLASAFVSEDLHSDQIRIFAVDQKPREDDDDEEDDENEDDQNQATTDELNGREWQTHEESDEHLVVRFFVVNDDDSIRPARRVEESIIGAGQQNLSSKFWLSLRLQRENGCADEPCPYHQRCRHTLKFLRTTETLVMDGFVFRGLETANSFGCECPRGFTTVSEREGSCNQRLNMCLDSPCRNGGTCVPLENGYRCECLPSWMGPNCVVSKTMAVNCWPGVCHSGAECHLSSAVNEAKHQQNFRCDGCPWRFADSDDQCRLRSASFFGNALVHLPAAIPRLDWALELRFATAFPSGTLLWAGDESDDHLWVHLVDGVPHAELSLGSGATRISVALADKVQENHLDDGEWHLLHVRYAEWKLRLWVDNCCDPQLALILQRNDREESASQASMFCVAEASILLSERCRKDPSYPCHRHLDLPAEISIGGRPEPYSSPILTRSLRNATKRSFVRLDKRSQQTIQKHMDGFVGVIADIRLDEELLSFERDLQERMARNDSSSVVPGAEVYRPDVCALDGGTTLCAHRRCENRWIGHVCVEPIDFDEDALAFDFDWESHASWQIPTIVSQQSFYALKFEFHTRQSDAQLMVLELGQTPTNFVVFGVKENRLLVHLGAHNKTHRIEMPRLRNDRWHSLIIETSKTLEETSVQIIVDALYKKSISMTYFTHPSTLYAGIQPSSAHPRSFLGCLRNIGWTSAQTDKKEWTSLLLDAQSRVRTGCKLSRHDDCSSKSCSLNSRCLSLQSQRQRFSASIQNNLVSMRENQHYSRVSPCFSIEGLCGPGGRCVSSSNANESADSRGYYCICAEGRRGANCEWEAVPAFCPRGWFGEFPECRPCRCAQESGFEEQCDTKSGECRCPRGTFNQKGANLLFGRDRCVMCECGVGSIAEIPCDASSGKCTCLGKAVGRRCDRCANTQLNLDRKTLDCKPPSSAARCASQMALGIEWLSTVRGATTRHSCPWGQHGISTRLCQAAGGSQRWASVDIRNCTLPSLFELLRQIDTFLGFSADGTNVLKALSNITDSTPAFNVFAGKNFDAELVILKALIDEERFAHRLSNRSSDTARNPAFVRFLLKVFDRLLWAPGQTIQQRMALIEQIAGYGELIARIRSHSLAYSRFLRFQGRSLLLEIHPSANDAFSAQRWAHEQHGFQVTAWPWAEHFTHKAKMNDSVFSQRKSFFAFLSPVSFRAICKARFSHNVSPSNEFDEPDDLLLTGLLSTLEQDCQQFEYPILMYSSHQQGKAGNESEMVEFVIPLFNNFSRDVFSWKHVECVRFHSDKSGFGGVRYGGTMGDDDGRYFDQLLHNAASATVFSWQASPNKGNIFGINQTHAICRFLLDVNAAPLVITLVGRADPGLFAHFSRFSGLGLWARAGPLELVATLCFLFAMALLAAAAFFTVRRNGLRPGAFRIGLLLATELHAFATELSLRVTFAESSAESLCPVRNALLVLGTCALFSWLFLHAFHIYISLVGTGYGLDRSCASLSMALGLVVPSALSLLALLVSGDCDNELWDWLLLLLAGPSICFLMLTFYALVTSFAISLSSPTRDGYRSPENGFSSEKCPSIRQMLAQIVIVVLLCSFYEVLSLIQLFKIVTDFQSAQLALITNIQLVITAIYLFVWATFLTASEKEPRESVTKHAENQSFESDTWVVRRGDTADFLNSQLKNSCYATFARNNSNWTKKSLSKRKEREAESGRQPTTPTYKRFASNCVAERGKVYEGPPNDWVPAVAPSETYVHHTLDKPPPDPTQILSPVSCINSSCNGVGQKAVANCVCCHQSATLGRRHLSRTRPIELDWQNANFSSATLARSPITLARRRPSMPVDCDKNEHSPATTKSFHNSNSVRANNSQQLPSSARMFTATADEMNEAYLTYTMRRQKHTSHASPIKTHGEQQQTAASITTFHDK